MKNRYPILLALIFCLLASGDINAQSWVPVGSPSFSAGEADFESIAFDKNDTLYIAYQDHANSDKATVMKFNGTNWVPVGIAGFSSDIASSTSLIMDSSGRPYVAFADYADTTKATVMKYDGTSWVTIGSQGFSIGIASYTTMAIGSSDTPYVAFLDQADSCIPRISVMKFDGSNWVYLGGPRFSPIITNPVSMAVRGNTPYIASSDTGMGKAIVLTWNGSSWVLGGTPDFSAGMVYGITLAFDSTGTLYVAYTDHANRNKATVMKYNGTAWTVVGSAGFSGAEADNITIAIDRSGIPYVAYSDASTADVYATVKKFDGSSWVTLGSPGFSGTLANYVTMAIDRNSTPYVGYQGFTGGQKATVMKYEAGTRVQNTVDPSISISVFPDPSQGSFSVNIASPETEEATITITNILGEQVKKLAAITNSETQVVLNDPPGIYVVTIETAHGKRTTKITVQ